MVLQDLGDVPLDSFNDPSGVDDQYSSARRPFDASQLPQPVPVFGPLFGFSGSLVRFKTEQTIKFAEKRVHRPLTAGESQALAFHLYKMEQTKSYFCVAGTVAGVWRWHKTMAESRYPFYKPKPEDINPNKFMFVRGPRAQLARQSWRLMLYMFVAAEFGKIVGQLFAQPIAARDTSADPQLSQFATDLKASIESDAQRIRNGTSERGQAIQENLERARRGERPPHAGAPRPWGGPRRSEPAPAPAASEDDMSPTAGNDPWSSLSPNAYGDAGFSPDDRQDGSQPQQAQANTQRANSSNRSGNRPSEDSASPTGGLFQDEAQQNQSRSNESAWDRLRRAGGPPQRRAEPPYREQKEGSTLGDSFAFAESDEERKRAQEKAQREFDERLERERQGRDFNDEKRW